MKSIISVEYDFIRVDKSSKVDKPSVGLPSVKKRKIDFASGHELPK